MRCQPHRLGHALYDLLRVSSLTLLKMQLYIDASELELPSPSDSSFILLCMRQLAVTRSQLEDHADVGLFCNLDLVPGFFL